MKYASTSMLARGPARLPAGQTLLSRSNFARAAKALGICLVGSVLALSARPAWAQVGHIHELYFNGSTWADADLTALTAANPASSFAGMSAFVTANGALHANYQDEFGNIHQLYFTGGSWFDANLTTAINGASARSGASAMGGFAVGNNQYIYFVGWDLHIHEYSYVTSWIDTDLTALTGALLAGPAYEGQQLAAVLTVPDNHRHIFYPSKKGSIEQISFDGTSWSKQNLSGKNRAKADVSSFNNWIGACNINNEPILFFASPDHHLHEFSYFRRWQDTDLTATVTGVTTGGAAVRVVTDPGISRCGVYYNDSNGHIHNLSNNGTGVEFLDDQDLTALTGGAWPASGGAGFSTSPGNWEHFFTTSSSGVNEFTFNGTSWSFVSLPGGAYWEPYGLAGFSVGGLEHVYYLASSN